MRTHKEQVRSSSLQDTFFKLTWNTLSALEYKLDRCSKIKRDIECGLVTDEMNEELER